MRKIEVGKNLYEVTPHGDYGFPFHLEVPFLSEYEHGSFAVHWHPEVEFTLVLEGDMEYRANQTVYHLSGGNGVFVNANCLHTASSCEGRECRYFAFVFNPVLVYGHDNSTVGKKYVEPVIASSDFSSFLLDPNREEHREMLNLFRKIYRVYSERGECYELRIKSLLCRLWLGVYQEFRQDSSGRERSEGKNLELLRQMLNYMHENYATGISLEDIAASCHVSKSKCCHFFKETMRLTPFEYLLKYRIQKSLPLLLEGCRSITEISEMTGFSGSSYFSEIFRRYMNCTPSEYRRKHTPGN
jgi:AraC family transcriptional regulator, melibiose operon regulatory protein